MTQKPLIDQGFILCAGFGTRMRPLTDTMPKPMVKIAGKPMVDHVLDSFAAHGITRTVINTHYRPESLENHVRKRSGMDIRLSRETDILETGGGITHALPLLEPRPFFISSGDSYLLDAPDKPALQRMEDAWDLARMDILILLQPVAAMTLTEGVGDYDLDGDGRAIRSHNKTGQYMFTGLRINDTHIFENAPEGAYSYLVLLDRAEKNGRLYGLIHDGDWHHVSTPDDVRRIEGALAVHSGNYSP